MTSAIEQQVNAVTELSKAISNINEMSKSISAATNEQATNSRQVSKAIEDVNEITQQAASAAEEMSASTEQLSTMAQQLINIVSQFKLSNAKADARALPEKREGSQEAGGMKNRIVIVDESEEDVTGIALRNESRELSGIKH